MDYPLRPEHPNSEITGLITHEHVPAASCIAINPVHAANPVAWWRMVQFVDINDRLRGESMQHTQLMTPPHITTKNGHMKGKTTQREVLEG